MGKLVWTKLPDNRVRHVWKKAEDDECGEGPDTAVVSPDWYAENGTPMCPCGEDMEYSHTEVLMPSNKK